jgi:hypothetical protein
MRRLAYTKSAIKLNPRHIQPHQLENRLIPRNPMSTRHSIFYHNDESTGIKLHIYIEVASEKTNDIRLEIEFPNGVVNVPWPQEAFMAEMRKRI